MNDDDASPSPDRLEGRPSKDEVIFDLDDFVVRGQDASTETARRRAIYEVIFPPHVAAIGINAGGSATPLR